MNVRPLRLIAGPRDRLPLVHVPLLDDLHHLAERRGERIAAIDHDTMTLLGAIGIYPDRNEGSAFYHLDHIDVLPAYTGMGVDAFLMEQAGVYLRERHVTRLKFGTSPLLTANAELYVIQFGARYRWREGARTPAGQPWPYVACECDFDDPLARALDLMEEDVAARSVLDWVAGRPVPRARVTYSGPLSVLLPDLDGESLAAAEERDPAFLPTLHDVFHALHVHGYGFAWFDRLSDARDQPGQPTCYYIMKRVVSF
jgi:GNAT superfamily N-acetyltransferase